MSQYSLDDLPRLVRASCIEEHDNGPFFVALLLVGLVAGCVASMLTVLFLRLMGA